jgi:hypothetical protein
MSITMADCYQFNNNEMKVVLVENSPSLDLKEVGHETERNFRKCVRHALKVAVVNEENHDLHVCINGRYWLNNPLSHIQEAVESEDGKLLFANTEKRYYKISSEEGHEVRIFLHGGNGKEEDEEEDAEAEEETVKVKQEVIEILDTSNDCADNDDDDSHTTLGESSNLKAKSKSHSLLYGVMTSTDHQVIFVL